MRQASGRGARVGGGSGAVVNIASEAGRAGSSGEPVYCGAKGAVIAFSKAIAREVARYGIRVNVVTPGLTDTPFLQRNVDEGHGKLMDAMVAATPLRRLPRLEELEGYLDEAAGDPGVRAVVLAASGEKAFCVGADLKVLAREYEGTSGVDVLVDTLYRVYGRLESFARPVVAAINGYCLGGGLELALTADLRVAADNARLGLPEARVGRMPGGGGGQG